MADDVLVGANLALLVSAALLGAAGRNVVVLTDEKPLGGHFRGVRAAGHDFDLGMVLLERARPGVDSHLGQELGSRADWARSGDLVDSVITSCVRLRRTPTPQSLVGSRRWPDHVIANRLDVVAGGSFEPPPPLPRTDPRHAAAKATSAAYSTLTYADAARVNHGVSIHERLVEPFVRKVMGVGSPALLARHHRAFWAPLYWPETLAAACAGRPDVLAEYPFWTTDEGFTGQLVRILEEQVQRMPHVTLERSPVASMTRTGDAWTVRTTDGGSWTADQPVLGVTARRARPLLGLTPTPERPAASVTLLCALVRGASIEWPVSCLCVVDQEYATYRVTDQDALAGADPEWHRIVLEAGGASGAHEAADLVSELVRLLGLRSAEDVQVVKTIAASGALFIPTPAAVAADAVAHSDLSSAAPGAVLTGSLLGSAAASLNEQTLQGLTLTKDRT